MNSQSSAQESGSRPDSPPPPPQRSSSAIQKRRILSSNTELIDDLRGIIQDYLVANKLHSIASLSRLSGVADSTIRRIMHEGSVPDLGTVLALTEVIYSLSQRREFLSKHFPKPYELVDHLFSRHGSGSHSSGDLSHSLDSEIARGIFQLCANRQTITEQDITETYGEHGRQHLEELIATGHISLDENGETLHLEHRRLEENPEVCLKNIRMWTRMYDPSLAGTDAALIATSHESLSLDGLKAMKKIGVDYLKKVTKIIREHPGDIPVCVAILQNIYDDQALSSTPAKGPSVQPTSPSPTPPRAGHHRT